MAISLIAPIGATALICLGFWQGFTMTWQLSKVR